ncbi:GNAT family N-acetyltransferase [Cytobacillus suaedae]|nr:GNAT family N-acetyltransferase [Cytobacillus suaedae]
MVVFKELTTKQEFLDAYKVMHELRTHLDEDGYLELLEPMLKEGYRMLVAVEENEIVAATGIIQLTNFYNGKHIYVYDLVTAEAHRSKGYGEKLLSHIHTLAVQEGCSSVALSSGLQRKDAHRFYEEKMGYLKTSYAFVKNL